MKMNNSGDRYEGNRIHSKQIEAWKITHDFDRSRQAEPKGVL